jgi:phosphoglycolate phosphatase
MNLLFDLDGTLTDPGVGITRCIQHALRTMGRAVPATPDLLRFVGPPLRGTFAELLRTSDAEQVEDAIRIYRDRFTAVGMFENQVYAEVPEAVGDLRGAGHRLWVVTSKPHVYARRIVDHFGLGAAFESVYGSELSGANVDKADLIRVVLHEEKLDAGETWMIGDRAQDILGARSNGVASIAALWGYGTEDELRGASPDWMATSITEIPRWARSVHQ